MARLSAFLYEICLFINPFSPLVNRISIQHVNIHQPKRVRILSESDSQSDTTEAKIYAISSEGGNIIYHVSNDGKTMSQKTSEELQTYALTTITEAGSSTQSAKDTKVETELHFEKVNPSNLSLRLNPFGSQNSLDRVIFDGFEPPASHRFPNLQHIRRLNAETCKKEGIFFDDNEFSDADTEGTVRERKSSDTKSKISTDSGTSSQGASPDTEKQKTSANKAEIAPQIQNGTESHTAAADEIEGDSNTNAAVSMSPEETNAKHDPGTPTEDVVMEIIEDIIEQVLQQDSEEAESIETNARITDIRLRRLSAMSQDEMDGRVSEAESASETDIDGKGIVSKHDEDGAPNIHPLHTHILLYTQKLDAQRTLHALSCLKGIIGSNPRLIGCAVSTTSLSNANTPRLQQLHNLLLRHRRSVFGKNFFSELPADLSAFRNAMFVEILISISLYYIRSYYPNLMMSKLSDPELAGNKEIQILSSELLTMLLSELINIAKDSGKGFSTYIGDLLSRCKLQKVLLHCLLASVHNGRLKPTDADDIGSLSEAIIGFNEDSMDSSMNETFQIKLLQLILVIIVLEDQIRKSKTDAAPEGGGSGLPPEWERIKLTFHPQSIHSVRFLQNKPLVYQGMLLSAVLTALKQQHRCHMHRHWIAMVTSAMPYMWRSLSHTLVNVVNQLCRNVELLSQQYELGTISAR